GAVAEQGGQLVVPCAGRGQQVRVEGGHTAGRVIQAVARGRERAGAEGGRRAAIALTDAVATWTEALEGSEAARQLAEADLAEDVRFAAKPDRFTVVPSYADRRIT